MSSKRNTVIFVAAVIIFLFKIQSLFSADPKYTLKVTNIIKTNLNALEFDINIAADSGVFEYAAGQYFFDFNTGIGNSGTFTYSIVNSDLPLLLQPRNPVVFVMGGEMQLRLTINTIPNPGQGVLIPSSGQGTKIVRMRLETTASLFDEQYFQLRWRNGPTNPYTKIYAYIGTNLTEITTPATHSIDSLQDPLPVELNNFIAEVSGNNVNLKWSTSVEINNKGFHIERTGKSKEWANLGFVKGNGNTGSISEYSFTDNNLASGIYEYRLKQTDFNGSHRYYYLSENVAVELPSDFYMSQNYPNPFNPSTNIDYNLPKEGNIEISIFDIMGRKIFVAVNENKRAGYHTLKLNYSSFTNGLSSGTYFYRIMFNDDDRKYSLTKKFTFIK